MSAKVPFSKVGSIVEGCTRLARLSKAKQGNADVYRIQTEGGVLVDINFSSDRRCHISCPTENEHTDPYDLEPGMIMVWFKSLPLLQIWRETAYTFLSDQEYPNLIDDLNRIIWKEVKQKRESGSVFSTYEQVNP